MQIQSSTIKGVENRCHHDNGGMSSPVRLCLWFCSIGTSEQNPKKWREWNWDLRREDQHRANPKDKKKLLQQSFPSLESHPTRSHSNPLMWVRQDGHGLVAACVHGMSVGILNGSKVAQSEVSWCDSNAMFLPIVKIFCQSKHPWRGARAGSHLVLLCKRHIRRLEPNSTTN